MKEINVTVIGSGSTYTPELIDGLIQRRDSIPLAKLTLMDIDERKLTVVGNLCKRMLCKAGIDCEFTMTQDLDTALAGADFIVSQIRVGKLPARHLDETIPLRYNLIGQETTGIGGFFKALRTIPVMAHITERIEAICPNAWLINFTNPSGLIADFIQNHTSVKSIGLCNCPINMLDDVRQATADPDCEITYLGLNHLSWITSILSGGKDILPELLNKGYTTNAMANIVDHGFTLECLQAAGGIPSSYLQYYYDRNAKLEHLKSADKSRAEECMEIEEQLLALYSDTSLDVKPALLDKRGGHKYSLAAISLIDSIATDKQDIHVVNIRNQGTLKCLHDNDVVEIAAIIGKDGAKPVPVGNQPNSHMTALMQAVKQYERDAVIAAMDGDETAAMRALMIHPLIGDFDAASKCFAELKEAHKQYLPQFFKA